MQIIKVLSFFPLVTRTCGGFPFNLSQQGPEVISFDNILILKRFTLQVLIAIIFWDAITGLNKCHLLDARFAVVPIEESLKLFNY